MSSSNSIESHSIHYPVLSVKNLRVIQDKPILQGLSWQIDPGQHWVILGANGSGKTSLLRSLTGLLTPSQGILQIGENIYGNCDWQQAYRSIGLVSSSLAQRIEPDQRVGDVILSGLIGQINVYPSGVTPHQRRAVRKILRRIEALSLIERAWLHLSQGERQRILIGRALATHPKVLFLDEPCAGLDPAARETFLHWLEDLMRPQTGEEDEPQDEALPDPMGSPHIVFVTHHVEEIGQGFTHALLLRSGKALAQGPLRSVMTSKNLSDAFDCPMNLTLMKGRDGSYRYRLQIDRYGG